MEKQAEISLNVSPPDEVLTPQPLAGAPCPPSDAVQADAYDTLPADATHLPVGVLNGPPGTARVTERNIDSSCLPAAPELLSDRAEADSRGVANTKSNSTLAVVPVAEEERRSAGQDDGGEGVDDESDEPESSGDEGWSEASDGSAASPDEEALTAESAESEPEETEDISLDLVDVDVQQRVTALIAADTCENKCLQGKARELELLACSISQMSMTEKATRIYTLLGVLMQTPTAARNMGSGLREKFHYFLPFVGHVCRPSFARCYEVAPLTIQRYKTRVREGNISVKAHGNTFNSHAGAVDLAWLVKWFKEFAAEVGEVVPVRVRMQKKADGKVTKYYSSDDYTMLPAFFTWASLHEEMQKYVEQTRMRVREPAASTLRKLLSLHCPTIRIRSGRSNVCDLCSIYQTRLRHEITAERTEEFGKHTESARRMRREYKEDKVKKDDSTAVIVMDFSQNLSIPSITSTPSQWYFCSLVAVSVFGVHYENEGQQTNYIYDETVSGKGSVQINSMLAHFIKTKVVATGKKRLIVYADNCSGQNKNNLVIKFFLAQVHMGVLEHVDYKFFIKGHTKNSCDRGFGHIRKHLARVDCWTMDHILDAVKSAAISSETVHIPLDSAFFMGYKPIVTELYKTLEGVQRYQIFSMDSTKPGVVICKKDPDSEPVEQDLRRTIDCVKTTADKVCRMFSDYLEPLPPLPLNAEKLEQMHTKILPYVPEEYKNDPIYAAPTAKQGEAAKATKQARRVHRAALAVTAKRIQDRDVSLLPQDSPPGLKKKQKTTVNQSAVV